MVPFCFHNKDQKVKAHGVSPDPCKDMAREGQHVCENLEQAGYLVQSAYLPNLAHSHYKSNFNEVGFPSVPPSMTTEERTYHRTQFSLDRTCAHGHSGNSTDRNSPHH